MDDKSLFHVFNCFKNSGTRVNSIRICFDKNKDSIFIVLDEVYRVRIDDYHVAGMAEFFMRYLFTKGFVVTLARNDEPYLLK